MNGPIPSNRPGGELPPADQLPTQRDASRTIVRIAAGERQHYTICSHALVGVWTHFVGEARTYPCLGVLNCYFDHAQTSLRWQGWLQVVKYGQRRPQFLPLTWAAVRDEQRLRSVAKTIRGKTLYLSRSGHSIRSRQYAVMGYDSEDQAGLPSPYDVRQWLMDLWGHPSTWPNGAGPRRTSPLLASEVAWDDDPFKRLLERGEQ